MEDGYPYEDETIIHFDDSIDLEEHIESKIVLVGLLIADVEPPQTIVKEILRAAWSRMGPVKVNKAKENVYSITVAEEEVAGRIIDGNPWFIKGYTFTVKPWPLYHSLDDIQADRAIYWVQAHGLPRNLCTAKNARQLGSRIGAVMEVEDTEEAGFRGFLRMRIEMNAAKPIAPGFFMPCPVAGKRRIRLKYEGLKDYCMKCGRLGHSRGCQWPVNSKMLSDGWHLDDDLRAPVVTKQSSLLCPKKKATAKPIVRPIDIVDRNHWLRRLEKDGVGLYDSPAGGQHVNASNNPLDKATGDGITATSRSRQMTQSIMQKQTDGLQFETSQTVISQRGMSGSMQYRPGYVSRWNPESYGTQYKNGTLTLAVHGLSLNHNWRDPDRIPPWALTPTIPNPTSTLGQTSREIEEQCPKETQLAIKEIVNSDLNSQVDLEKNQGGKKKRGKEKEALGDPCGGPNKKVKVHHSPPPGCSLRLSCRGGRGSRGKPRGGQPRGRSTKTVKQRTEVGQKTDDGLCDVIISPSKELEEIEARLRQGWKDETSSNNGGGGWPKAATRNQ